MEAEKIKAILLATACFFMACLNLWNLFKDWFDKKYKPRKGDAEEIQPSPQKEQMPDIIGKSKFKLSDERKPKQEEPLKQDNPLKKEIVELKELILQQSKMIEDNKPFISVPMEVRELSNIDTDTLDGESIPLLTEKEHSQFSTGTTLDELELVVKTLKGKPITKEEEKEVSHIIPKIEGTDIYNQFTKQIHGAEERAIAILNRIEDNRQALSSNGTEGFDYKGFVRE